MIVRNGQKISRINIGGDKEVYRVYFNDRVVFKRFHPVTAIVATTNKQYIDSEMKDFWVDDMDFEITYANNWNSVCIWGCRPDKSYQEFGIICGNDQRVTVRKGGTVVNGTAPNWYQTAAASRPRFTYDLLGGHRGDSNDPVSYDITAQRVIKKVGDKVYLDGDLLGFTNSSSCQNFFLTYLPPYFFRLNQSDFELDSSGINSSNDNGVKYLYRATFYYQGKLYRDFVPVLDKNNVPALYEKVTRKFHYSITDTPLEYFNENYGQLACIYGCTPINYVNTGILPKDIGKWKMRIQSSATTVARDSTNYGMGSLSGTSGLYFTRYGTTPDFYYELHIGEQVIQTTIPYISDSEIIITFDLLNKQVTIERNQQEKLTNEARETYTITSTSSLEDLPSITLGYINGQASIGASNFRIYRSEIYDKEGKLIQDLKPRVNLTTKKACMYDELSKTPYITGTVSFI